MSQINYGWLYDGEQQKFAPKTIAQQVIIDDTKTLDTDLTSIHLKIDNIPSPTTSDNDKILSVVNGAYSLITVTNAEGVKY